jgi:hypothetical protein
MLIKFRGENHVALIATAYLSLVLCSMNTLKWVAACFGAALTSSDKVLS